MKPVATISLMMFCFALLSAGAPTSPLAAKKQKQEQKQGQEPKDKIVDCTMIFDLKSWSAFYKSSKGDGAITCDNGQTAKVKIKAKGGGITFGESDIINGTGHFTGVRRINELFGSYAQAEVHAGAGNSAAAQAMTKGGVSLVLSGTGQGVDLGFAFGKFTIGPAKRPVKDTQAARAS
jgi:hypothetical protein